LTRQCYELRVRLNSKFLDKSFALHPNLLLGASDSPRDCFVRLSIGKAPQQQYFAWRHHYDALTRLLGWRNGLSVRPEVQINTHWFIA
jgi:hypothetical protein